MSDGELMEVRMTWRWQLVALLLALGGCAPGSRAEAQRPAGPRGHDTVPRGVVDTEESLWPDPVVRTQVRLSSLQHLIENHERVRGTLPATLDEVLPPGEGPVVLEWDAWGNRILYSAGRGDYEVRAPGPDGGPGTADDIVARRGTELPVRQPVSGRTGTILQSLQSLVLEYRARNGTFPESLEALARAGLRPYLGTTDEWGNPIHYLRDGTGFELRAPGPDGTMRTRDDLIVQGDSLARP
jgi:hypothetical protein